MASLNKTEIIGNVGRETEMRFSKDGKPVTNFSVAVDEKYKTRDGEVRQDTEWFEVTTWGKLAEICNQYVNKGMLVYVSGKAHLHKWTKPDGGEATKLQLNAQSVLFLEKREASQSVDESVDKLAPDDIPF